MFVSINPEQINVLLNQAVVAMLLPLILSGCGWLVVQSRHSRWCW